MVTKVNVVRNESLELPTSTICLPLEFGELDYNYSPNKQNMYYQSLIKFLNEQKITKDYLMPADGDWDNSVQNVVHAYLIEVSGCEYGNHCNCSFVNDNGLSRAMDILETIMLRLNISIDELRQRFGVQVAALYSLQIGRYDLKVLDKIINVSRTTLIDGSQICYGIQFNLYPLKASSFFGIIFSEHSLPSPHKYGENRNYSIYFGKRFLTYDRISESRINSLFRRIEYYTVELTKYRTPRGLTGGKECCNELSLEECHTICRIKHIQNHCKCLPTLWPELIKHVNYV